MAEVRLNARRRTENGKGPSRRARAAGRIPGILYGRGMEPVSLDVDRRELVTALHTDAGMNVLLDIEIDGETTLALARELQRDPVKGTVVHADFVKIDRSEKIEVEVPLHVTGEAPGVAEGGVLETPLFQLSVRCLPTDVPEEIVADISGLAIGDALRVGDITADGDFEILNDPDEVAVHISAPVSEAELQEMVEGVTTEVPEEEAATAAEVEAEAEATEAEPPSSEEAGDN